MKEEWRPVIGFESSHQVSNLGRARGIDRFYMRHGYPVRVRGRVHKLGTTRHGYKIAALGRVKNALVHRLVLEAFVGPAPADKPEGCHIDGNPSNNQLSNLRWGDRKDNMRDMLLHGRHNNARKTHCKNGHEFSPENTVPRENGNRRCLTCRTETMARFLARRRESRAA